MTVLKMNTIKLSLDQIKQDRKYQIRKTISVKVAEEYAAKIQDGEVFPPVAIKYIGDEPYLISGFHRCKAYEIAGIADIDAVDIGDQDALLYAIKENSQHGRPLTNKEKRKVAIELLKTSNCEKGSDRDFAKLTGFSHTFFQNLRKELMEIDNPKEQFDAPQRAYPSDLVKFHELRTSDALFTNKDKPLEISPGVTAVVFCLPEDIWKSNRRKIERALKEIISPSPIK